MGVIIIFIAIISAALLGKSIPYSVDPGLDSNIGQSIQDACKPSLDTNRALTVNVDPTLNGVYGSGAQQPWARKDDKKWVLVKVNAPVPAWKVELEGHSRRGPNDPNLGEMERIGTTDFFEGLANPDAEEKEVYVGVGWCDPQTGEDLEPTHFPEGCKDPLVQDVIYVVTRKGITRDKYYSVANQKYDCPETYGTDKIYPIERHDWYGCHAWGEGTLSDAEYAEHPRNQENVEDYWWTFNVYINADLLPADATNDDLPCWMHLQCPGGSDVLGGPRKIAADDSNCYYNEFVPDPFSLENDTYSSEIAQDDSSRVLGTQDENRPKLILSDAYFNITNPPSGVEMKPFYISYKKLASLPNDVLSNKIGQAYKGITGNYYFDVYIRTGNISGTSADHILILDPTPSGHPNGPFWAYIPILKDSKPAANSLQLGSFVPGIPSYFYEWWTPACKPALYLYPEKEMNLSVFVNPNGYITESIPEHGSEGWNVKAYPDGTIFDNNQLSIINNQYLYYEAVVKNVNVPKDKGWIKGSDELLVFFNDVLPKLGLNQKESYDFKEYWIPKLQDEGENWFITLIDEDEVNRVEPVTFSIKPDNFLRIRFYFEKIDENIISQYTKFNIPDTKYERNGFTVIDWGGILGNGSCGAEEIIQ